MQGQENFIMSATQATAQLATLINDYAYHKEFTLDDEGQPDFPDKAIALIKRGANPLTRADIGSKGTLLHYLVLENAGNINVNAIQTLLQYNPWLSDTLDDNQYTPFQKLLSQPTLCISALKPAAIVLAPRPIHSHIAWLHQLVLTNVDGRNDREINLLLKQAPTLIDAPNMHQCTPLQELMNLWLACECETKTFKHTALLLANEGCNLWVQDTTSMGATLIHHLMRTNYKETHNNDIETLLTLDPTLTRAIDKDGNTVLHQLLYAPDVSIQRLKSFIPKKLKEPMYNERGQTPLHIACLFGHLNAALYLVEQGFDIHALTESNQTMLHLAASNNNQALWQWLIDQSIDPFAQDVFGQTAVELRKPPVVSIKKSPQSSSVSQSRSMLFFQAGIKDKIDESGLFTPDVRPS